MQRDSFWGVAAFLYCFVFVTVGYFTILNMSVAITAQARTSPSGIADGMSSTCI